MSTYRLAIDQTEATIQRRSRYFRNQVVSVVLVTLVTLVSAWMLGTSSVLVAILGLIPLCGAFAFADGRLLGGWRSKLMRPWVEGQLDFAAFRHAIRAHPRLPPRTLEAMLATLPSAGTLVEEQAMVIPTRQAIAAACANMYSSRADVVLLKVLASGIVTAAIGGAVWTHSDRPLIGCAMLGLLPITGLWMRRRRRARCEADVASCRAQPGFNDIHFARVCESLRE